MTNMNHIKVIKKDLTREDFNVQKVIIAVGKSAERALVTFTQDELDFLCRFVEDTVLSMGVNEIPIATMHNIVESAFGFPPFKCISRGSNPGHPD